MERRLAKEYLHLRDWLARAERVVGAGRARYDTDELLQEAGDSLMMKIGETANRLRRAGETEPAGVTWAQVVANRNWLIHQYDQIDRDITWATLTTSLPELTAALAVRFIDADHCLEAER